MATFADRVKELRTERGYTHKQLADLLGVSESTISMWEIGKRSPTKNRLYHVADFFHVTFDYMTGKSDVKRPFFRDNASSELSELMADMGADNDGVYLSDEELAMQDILRANDIIYHATADGRRIAIIEGREIELSVEDAVAMAKRLSAYAKYLFEDKLL